MLVAIHFHEGQSWFYKAMGLAAAVGEQKTNFEEFLRSVSYE